MNDNFNKTLNVEFARGGIPSQVLIWPCEELVKVNDKTTDFSKVSEEVANMFATMKRQRGVGLASNQIGSDLRIVIIDHEGVGFSRVMVNPEVLKTYEDVARVNEGCLSVPGFEHPILRFHKIDVRYQNIEGEEIEETLTGMSSYVTQHEIDHLNGIVFVNYLSVFKQKRAKEKSRKFLAKRNRLIKDMLK